MDPVTFGEARLAETGAATRSLLSAAQSAALAVKETRLLGREIPGWHDWPDVITTCNQVLREVEAGHRILARHRGCMWGAGYCGDGGHGGGDGDPCGDLADLLYRWADHPDYDPAWRPA